MRGLYKQKHVNDLFSIKYLYKNKWGAWKNGRIHFYMLCFFHCKIFMSTHCTWKFIAQYNNKKATIEFACMTKGFAITFVFPLLLFLVSVCGQTDKQKLNSYFSPIAALSACDQDWSYQNDMLCPLKPCPLEKNINAGLKWKHLESPYLYYHGYGHQTC